MTIYVGYSLCIFLIKAIVTSLASTLVFDVCNSLWSFMLMVLPSTVAIQCYKISSTAREEFSSYIIMTSIYFLALKILHIHSFKLIGLTEREMHVRNISNSYSEFLNLKIWSCYLLHAFSYDKIITSGKRIYFPIVCIRHEKIILDYWENEWRLQTNKMWYYCLSITIQSIEWASCSEELFCYYDVYSNTVLFLFNIFWWCLFIHTSV